MCGFTFVFPSESKSPTEIKLAHSFNQWRGNDDTIVSKLDDCYTAFSLLSFVQIENNANNSQLDFNQPFISRDNKIISMFNGEIYNYKDLKAKYHLDLADNECSVISEGYQKIGLDFIGLLDGMYASCIYDKNKQLIHLSRDYFGQKPLYYHINTDHGNPHVYASTSLKTISILANEPLKSEHIAEWIDLGFTVAPITIFNNIYKLAPGETITVDIRNCASTRSYLPSRFDPQLRYSIIKSSSSLNAANKICKTISRDIESTINHGQIKSALLLSKGIDSSIVEIFAEKLVSDSIDILSMDTGNGDTWEPCEQTRHKFKGVVGTINIQATIIDYLSQTRRGINPCSDIGMWPLLQLLSLYPDRKIALISGDGADELLFGYGKYHILRSLEGKKLSIHDCIKIWYKLRGNGILPLDYIEDRLKSISTQQSVPLDSLEIIRSIESKSYLSECVLLKTDNISYITNKEIRAPFLNLGSSMALASLPLFNGRFHSFQKNFFRSIIQNSHLRDRLGFGKKGFAPVGYFVETHLKTLYAMYGKQLIDQKISYICESARITQIPNDKIAHRILMLTSFV